MIRGTTELVAHIGYPTHTFKSPMIYNPFFEQAGIDAVVVPMSCGPEQYPVFLKSVFALTNLRGAIITMPHKVTTVALLDEATSAVKIAGSCNAVRRAPDGRLQGDLFDGEGFVRGVRHRGCRLEGARVLVLGLALVLVFGAGAPLLAQSPVKIGVIQPLSGSVAASGNYIRMGAEIARDWINAKGGVNGRKVELLIEDNKSDPKEAASAAEKLIVRDTVPATTGAWGSSMTLAAMPKLEA